MEKLDQDILLLKRDANGLEYYHVNMLAIWAYFNINASLTSTCKFVHCTVTFLKSLSYQMMWQLIVLELLKWIPFSLSCPLAV